MNTRPRVKISYSAEVAGHENIATFIEADCITLILTASASLFSPMEIAISIKTSQKEV